MNWKGCGRKLFWPALRVDENNKKLRSGLSISEPKIEKLLVVFAPNMFVNEVTLRYV
jgi:hypothetical protein